MTDVVPKLYALNALLLELLGSLEPADWQRPTVARRWTVKDVAAHLLDGNIRVLSGLRDGYRADNPEIGSYQDLLDYLNRLNADWVQAMRRVSPQVLVDLLRHTGPAFCDYYASLDPEAPAAYPVSWAGESVSTNRMHIAREYTEKLLHQQQIRDAVGRPGLLRPEFFHPFLDICMHALPHTLRHTRAQAGALLQMNVSGEAGGSWWVVSDGAGWKRFAAPPERQPDAVVTIGLEASWKLFSKSLRPADLQDQIQISGDAALAAAALEMVSFMA